MFEWSQYLWATGDRPWRVGVAPVEYDFDAVPSVSQPGQAVALSPREGPRRTQPIPQHIQSVHESRLGMHDAAFSGRVLHN